MTSIEANDQETHIEDYADGEEETSDVEEYDISASPNDFNVATMYDFIKSGVFVIPGFQRNYVWDIRRASKLIESLIVGLPVPQIFLHEAGRNRFHVIDGQQRLMSIYYFMEQRFPIYEARPRLRRIFAEHGNIPDEILSDPEYFTDFQLVLPAKVPGSPNRLHGLTLDGLSDRKADLLLRTVRNVFIRQNAPKDDDSSMYEIFSRLNSGGVNITPQEMRMSLYHSNFYNMLMRVNYEEEWRRLLMSPEPDLRLKDMELLLRMFAMLVDAERYSPSMSKFLNQFSKNCQPNNREKNQHLELIFKSFLAAASGLPDDVFLNKGTNRISVALMEAVFAAACRNWKSENAPLSKGKLDLQQITSLETDAEFVQASQLATTQSANVRKRLERGYALVSPL